MADIHPYLDIHLEVNEWLRDRGILSREHHVARLCMLGKWCAERGLDDRAAEMLAMADSLSEGMLTGKLWIADLHRLLGQEQESGAIEMKLLAHDLLPMSRVPSTLRKVATEQGQARADAIAFRVADYSNDPEILPAAIRHAEAKDLKEDARDLTERLHKVRTLFLPPDDRS